MLNGIFGFIIGFILFIIIVLAILYHKSIRNIKKILQQAADARTARKIAEEEAYFRRTSTKHYREEPKANFKKDYFKGEGTTEDRPKTQQQRPRQEAGRQEAANRRTVETDGGVTIIDDRGAQKQAERKIFDDNDGEYVDFVEVKD